MDLSWNHNVHYHDTLMRAVPPQAHRALDVGCGDGRFARRLALAGLQVDAIDPDQRVVRAARARTPRRLDVHYTTTPLAAIDLEPGAYDFISVIAAIHHMPFAESLRRLDAALAPGGVLAVLGLYRGESFTDHATSAAALLPQWTIGAGLAAARFAAGVPDPSHSVRPIIAAPDLPFRDLARETARALPGTRLRRHLFWRYSLIHTRDPIGGVRPAPLARAPAHDRPPAPSQPSA